jgi:hypothetical protein
LHFLSLLEFLSSWLTFTRELPGLTLEVFPVSHLRQPPSQSVKNSLPNSFSVFRQRLWSKVTSSPEQLATVYNPKPLNIETVITENNFLMVCLSRGFDVGEETETKRRTVGEKGTASFPFWSNSLFAPQFSQSSLQSPTVTTKLQRIGARTTVNRKGCLK